jgi:very-short-patch-repair endonuclease
MLAPLPDVLAELGGVATRAQLLARGYDPYGLTRAVRAGVVLRLRRSRYALITTDTPTRVAISMGGLLGGVSAARSYGWWAGTDQRIHVSWPAHGNVAKPGRVLFEPRPDIVHHWRILRASDERASLSRESPEETLAQVLLSSDRDTAIACADSAIHLGTLREPEVRSVLRSMPARVAEWEPLVDGRADSGLESIVRLWLREQRVPFRIHAAVRGVGEVDFLVGRSLIIETDGGAFHDGPAEADRDGRRDTEAGSRGYVTARLRYRMIMGDPARWQRRILEHVARGDHLRAIRS